MRTLLALGAALGLVLALAGCKGKADAGKDETQANARKMEDMAGKAYSGAGGKASPGNVAK